MYGADQDPSMGLSVGSKFWLLGPTLPRSVPEAPASSCRAASSLGFFPSSLFLPNAKEWECPQRSDGANWSTPQPPPIKLDRD